MSKTKVLEEGAIVTAIEGPWFSISDGVVVPDRR
jgi:hypothetical protein